MSAQNAPHDCALRRILAQHAESSIYPHAGCLAATKNVLQRDSLALESLCVPEQRIVTQGIQSNSHCTPTEKEIIGELSGNIQRRRWCRKQGIVAGAAGSIVQSPAHEVLCLRQSFPYSSIQEILRFRAPLLGGR